MPALTTTPPYGRDRASAILVAMPMPDHPAPERRFRTVELIRLFVEGKKGHPLYGLAALGMMIAAPLAYRWLG